MMKEKRFYIQTPKDVMKIIRSIIEWIIIIYLAYVIINAMFILSTYAPHTEVSDTDRGFIVVSYFGVERSGNNVMIGVDRLESHLKALYNTGYVTVTQQDIIDYYNSDQKDKQLPEKAMLLIFEDGNREASIFAQKVMEKYNFKATILTFGDSFEKKDPKMLTAKDMKELLDNTFWELGTNGYRMEYINVFDKDDEYMGEMDTQTMNKLRSNIGNRYDHFLMDYLRDEMGLPKESYDEMTNRIGGDYELMVNEFTREVGGLPELYAIVNPNTGAFGHNAKVSAINQRWIYDLFKINLNRLGFSWNNRENTVYDLTRTQPQPYWHANHLLMRVWSDTGQAQTFVTGDVEKAGAWDELAGEAEFDADNIIITSLPDGKGILRLKNGSFDSFDLSVQLNGNKYGSQSVLLGKDLDFAGGVSVSVKDNTLTILERQGETETQLYSLDLNVHDGNEPTDQTLAIDEPGSRLMEISVEAGELSVSIDGRSAVNNLKIPDGPWHMGLESETSARIINKREPVDNIYDGIFKGLVIYERNGEQILFDGRLKGVEAATEKVKYVWRVVIDWFIENL